MTADPRDRRNVIACNYKSWLYVPGALNEQVHRVIARNVAYFVVALRRNVQRQNWKELFPRDLEKLARSSENGDSRTGLQNGLCQLCRAKQEMLAIIQEEQQPPWTKESN